MRTGTTVETTVRESLRQQEPLALLAQAEGSSCQFAEGRRVVAGYGLAIGDGPAYAVGQGPDAVYSLYNGRRGDGLSYQRVLWLSNPIYGGPLLIRARQLDGPNQVRFREDLDSPLLAELELPTAGDGLANAPGWRSWIAYIVLSAPGCYAYQVDGAGFSQTIGFQVVRERPNQLFPLPPFRSLPRQLIARSAVTTGLGRVRLAFTGAQSLALRIDTAPTSTAPLDLSGPNVQRSETPAGPVLWQADTQQGWPTVAIWDDGRYRYRLTRLDSAPGDWALADLLALVTVFAAASAR